MKARQGLHLDPGFFKSQNSDDVSAVIILYNYIECSSPVSVIKEEATFLVRQNVTMYTGIPVQGLNFQYKKKTVLFLGLIH